MTVYSRFRIQLVGVALACLMPIVADAGVVRIIKTSPGHPDKVVRPKSADPKIDLAPGETATIINDDHTYDLIRGEYHGTVSEYLSGRRSSNSLSNRLAKLLAQIDVDNGRTGAVRSGDGKLIKVPDDIGGADIDLDYAGTQCYVLGHVPKVWRESGKAATSLWLTTAGAPSGKIEFAAGSQVAQWPGEVGPGEGTFWVIAEDGETETSILTIKQLPADDESPVTLAVLLDTGCDFQAAIELRKLVDSPDEGEVSSE